MIVESGEGYESLLDWKNWDWKVRNGKVIRFWLDVWIGEKSLKEEFPKLYKLAIEKKANLYQLWNQDGENIIYNLKWRRQLYDWEKVELDSLLRRIKQVSIQENIQDQLIWNGEKNAG